MIQIAIDGIRSWYGKERNPASPSLTSVPQDALGALTPRPIKLKKDSVNIALGTIIVMQTIIDAELFGIR